MQAKKQYTDDFKKEAIHLLETSDKTVTQIERDLGISHGLLRKWQKRFQVNPKTSKLELSEVENLKAELRQMTRDSAGQKLSWLGISGSLARDDLHITQYEHKENKIKSYAPLSKGVCHITCAAWRVLPLSYVGFIPVALSKSEGAGSVLALA